MTGPTISVVIPTCNRKTRLISLLGQLMSITYPIQEIIIVDSGDDRLSQDELSAFGNLPLKYLESPRSVCIQRNAGIRMATADWIWLCDDDIEVPPDYLQQLLIQIQKNPSIAAISGRWMQLENDSWTATYPIRSKWRLYWNYIFQLGIWGPIETRDNRIKRKYLRKGNHISRAGWPVNIKLDEDLVFCPVYSLGASLVKKEWLLNSTFDEVLDAHGIGDNYGVIMNFPVKGVYVTNATWVHHHREPSNRLKSTQSYYRRILALDYFLRINKKIPAKRRWLLWSLKGNLLSAIFSGNGSMARATLSAAWKIISGKNPYYIANKKGTRVVEPGL